MQMKRFPTQVTGFPTGRPSRQPVERCGVVQSSDAHRSREVSISPNKSFVRHDGLFDEADVSAWRETVSMGACMSEKSDRNAKVKRQTSTRRTDRNLILP